MMFHIYKELSAHGHYETVEDREFVGAVVGDKELTAQEVADQFCESESKNLGFSLFAEPFTTYRLFRSDNADGTGGQTMIKEIALPSDKEALLYITGSDLTVEAIEHSHTRVVKESP